jgi:hypothetical protein
VKRFALAAGLWLALCAPALAASITAVGSGSANTGGSIVTMNVTTTATVAQGDILLLSYSAESPSTSTSAITTISSSPTLTCAEGDNFNSGTTNTPLSSITSTATDSSRTAIYKCTVTNVGGYASGGVITLNFGNAGSKGAILVDVSGYTLSNNGTFSSGSVQSTSVTATTASLNTNDAAILFFGASGTAGNDGVSGDLAWTTLQSQNLQGRIQRGDKQIQAAGPGAFSTTLSTTTATNWTGGWLTFTPTAVTTTPRGMLLGILP